MQSLPQIALSPFRRMLLLYGCLAPMWAFGTLQWDSQRIDIIAEPSDKTISGVFRFVNSGDTPITISAIESSCGCTTAELEKRTYSPKEAGEIKVVFAIGDRVGLQEKSVLITTKDAPSAPTTLILRVTIPEMLSYSARLLAWKTGEELTEKYLSITANDSRSITAIEASPSTLGETTVRIDPIEAGKKYRIAVKPASTAKAVNQHLTFIAKFADGSTREFPVYAMVR